MRDTKHYATPDRTVKELYQATLSKRMALLRAGYTVIEMWECEWDRLVDNEPVVSQFLASFDLVPPLEPREAFFGGRTGAVALHAVAGEGEEVRYVDVTSLYPWVNKNCPYPIGHPQIITQPVDQSLGSYFGLATVDILPPAGLFHPVLPLRCSQKLTFPLCRTCVQEEQAQPMLTRTHYCPHSDVDRTLRGTWCTPELVKAVEKGYTLIKIHEVWHFPPRATPNGSFRQLREHVVKDQTKIGGVALLVSDPRAETRLYSSLPGTRGHPTRCRQYCQKSRSQGHSQVDVEQLLGQIR